MPLRLRGLPEPVQWASANPGVLGARAFGSGGNRDEAMAGGCSRQGMLAFRFWRSAILANSTSSFRYREWIAAVDWRIGNGRVGERDAAFRVRDLLDGSRL